MRGHHLPHPGLASGAAGGAQRGAPAIPRPR
jgi:hypothetical protein